VGKLGSIAMIYIFKFCPVQSCIFPLASICWIVPTSEGKNVTASRLHSRISQA